MTDEILGFKTKSIFADINPDCIISLEIEGENPFDIDILPELDATDEIQNLKIGVIKSKDKAKIEYIFERPHARDIDGIISDVLVDAIQKGHLKKDAKTVLILGEGLSTNYSKILLVIDVDRSLYRIGRFELTENMATAEVVRSVLNIAQALAREGREGKKVGTMFVIGDEDELEDYSKQLILNPFNGYSQEIVDIRNMSLQETIKNFAQLDGGFLVTNKGHVISAGTYFDVDTSKTKSYMGWGTRHLAASAITAVTNSVAVLVSESGGLVKVFKKGKLILKM